MIPSHLTHPGIPILPMSLHVVAVLSIKAEDVELRCCGELLLCLDLCRFRHTGLVHTHSLPHLTLL